jgi:Glycosyltransferase WbsX
MPSASEAPRPAAAGVDDAAAARARVVALYLPQFHPIPENDLWWGPGFTEWTNVTRARPLFRGHRQPYLPGELGFYDLRLAETRIAQADLARAYGVEAFCYWHYWFAGERLLERPFAEVLASGQPDFPFCLAWANQSWTGIWHGAPGRVLKEQTYPGIADYEAHFYAVLPALTDRRYVRVGSEPLFGVYRPDELPDAHEFIETWRDLGRREGLPGIYFVGFTDDPEWMATEAGFNCSVLHSFSGAARPVRRSAYEKVAKRLQRLTPTLPSSALTLRHRPRVYDYAELRLEHVFGALRDDQHPCLVSNWDNTPRSGRGGLVLHGATPELFGRQVEATLDLIAARPLETRFLFIKSWNEWAEGNHLEPDSRFGRKWLEELASALERE